MNFQATAGSTTISQRGSSAAEQVDRIRFAKRDSAEDLGSVESLKNLQPEELISQIKAITEDGLYSVQFENNESGSLVVKVVDRQTNEVIRQIPPEELLELSKHLKELSGNLVDTLG